MNFKLNKFAVLTRAFALVFCFGLLCGCTWFDDTPEQRMRRAERRRKIAQERQQDAENPTSLSGLTSVEMEAIRKTSRPRKKSDVFSVQSKNRLGQDDDLESLNENDQAELKKIHEQNQRQKKRGQNWVY